MQQSDFLNIQQTIGKKRDELVFDAIKRYFKLAFDRDGFTIDELKNGRYSLDVSICDPNNIVWNGENVTETYYFDGIPIISFGNVIHEVVENEDD
jgi:hypothetical protein